MGFSESLLNPSNFKAEDKMTLLFDRINFAGYIYTQGIFQERQVLFLQHLKYKQDFSIS